VLLKFKNEDKMMSKKSNQKKL